MSFIGLWKPPYGRIIPAEWFWLVVDGLDALYGYTADLKGEVEYLKDCIERKLDQANQYLAQLNVKVDQIEYKIDSKVVPTLQDIESKQDQANQYLAQISTKLDQIEVKLDNIQSKLDLSNHYLRFISSGKGIITVTKTVTTTPTPLYVDELQVRRIVIKVPTDALYMVYIGDEKSQEFPLEKGEKQELYVKDPRKVYIRAEGEVKVFLLFELAQ